MKKKILIALGVLLLLGVLSAVGGAFALYKWASKDLPDFKEITDFSPPLVTTVYARDDSILGYFYREKRFLVDLHQCPVHLTRAFLAAEDSSFYEHEGIDFQAIFRAVVKNVEAGTIKQGGSTITQQVIKRLLLTSEKSYERKLKEAILAYRLEKHLTKDEILTIYLNQIYLGSGAYGVEAAARTYFNKHVEALTLAESAMLAGLPQAPSRYSPYNHPETARKRQVYVLDNMLKLGWITQAEYDEAIAQELVFESMPDPSWGVGAYYLEEVRRWLIDYLSEENAKALGLELDRYGEDAVYESGLHVYTAVDMKHQAAAEQALRDGLVASTERRGWQGPLRHVDPEYYGSAAAELAPDLEKVEQGEWFQALVTEVSKDKALVRAGDVEGVIPVESVHWCREPDPKTPTDNVPAVKDVTKVLQPGDVVWAMKWFPEEEEGQEEKTQQEENAKEKEQAEPLRLELKQWPIIQGALVSLEPPTGEVRALVGGYDFQSSQFNRATQAFRQPGSAFKPIVYSAAIDNGFTAATMVMDAPFVYADYATEKIWRPQNFEGKFYGPTLLRTALAKSRNLCTIRVAQKLGVNAIIERAKALGLEPEFPRNLSVALGSVAVRPLNLCQAYTAFARGGSWVEPRLALRVESAWGKELFRSDPRVVDAFSPQTAFILTSLLKEVVQDGTGWRAKVLKRPVAGKTGTTNDEQDAWFMGFTPYLLTGVYVGFDQLQPMGRLETGSRAASPIWVQYRMAVEEDYPEEDFPQPPGINIVQVDAGTGYLAAPNSEKTFFLPFKTGTAPTQLAGDIADDPGDTSRSGEALMKQMF